MTTTLLRSSNAADHALSQSPRAELLDQLSRRELEVLGLVAEGWSNIAIGDLLSVELKTVETHISRVFTKLGLHEHRNENRRVIAAITFLGRASAQRLHQLA
jgi:DNA-binding NarL/FixJ family response regulator